MLLGAAPAAAAPDPGVDRHAAPARDTDAQEGLDEPESRSRFRSRASVDNAYSSNLFHIQRRRLEQFDTRSADGERFHGMRGPWDMATRVSLDGRLRYKLAKKRRLRASLGAAYVLHVRNDQANYAELWASLGHDPGKRDHLVAEAEVTPRRFRKNYRVDGAGGSGPFSAAHYLEVEPALGYGHDWSRAWTTWLVYDVRLRSFDAPHENHGEARHRVSVRSEHRLSRRVSLAFEAGPAIGLAPRQPEGGGYEVDRGYGTLEAGAGVSWEPLKRFELGFDSGYRFKEYTTDVEADALREGRRDHRVQLELWLDKRFGKHIEVGAYAQWTRNLTNRTDPAEEADAFDYEELVVGAGVTGRL